MEERLLATDLYDYLVSLASALTRAGESDAAARVLYVSKFVSGSTSEMYGEARLLLPKILDGSEATKLSDLEKARLREVVAGVEREFARVGGG